MQHQRQGPSECQLATLAMLAGRDLGAVRKMAEKRVKQPWVTFTRTVSALSYWAIIQELADNLALDITCGLFGAITKGLHKPILPPGRGQITIVFSGGSAHAVAYEDGLIYDPSEKKPLPLNRWWALYTGTVSHYYIDPVRDGKSANVSSIRKSR